MRTFSSSSPTRARSSRARHSSIALLVGLLLASVRVAPAAEIQHIRAFGDYVEGVAASGYFLGSSHVPATAERPGGRVSWIGSPNGAWHRIGLQDDLHVDDDRAVYTLERRINVNGVAIGGSVIFAGNRHVGKSAWVANSTGATIRLGFYDAEHTAADGRTWHEALELNDRNQVIGFSEGSMLHRTAWIAGPYTPLTRLGLFDAAHTSSDGMHWSEPVAINDAGYVVGSSRYYNGRDARTFGQTTWLYTPWGSFRLVGFQSGIHRTSTGWWGGEVSELTESGYLAGFSRRYRNDARNGTTAWLTHVGGPNRPVGFYDGIHTAPNQVAASRVRDLNENGIAAGESLQFTGPAPTESDYTGATAWLAHPTGETVRVGLYDAEHSRAGRQMNRILAVNENNTAVGEAERYDPVTGSNREGAGGRSAWLATLDGETIPLGLTDALHTRADGYRVSTIGGLTATRFVWGSNQAYGPGYGGNSTSWVYDRTTATYLILDEITDSPAGFTDSYITINDVSDSGVVIGSYSGPESNDTRAFIYVPGKGVRRLMDVDSSPDATLVNALVLTPNGYIVGEQAVGVSYETRAFLARFVAGAP